MMTTPSPVLLDTSEVTLQFGGIRALHRVSFEIHEGAQTGLIGPNGAGKTALLNCITSFYQPSEGTIRFGGKDITNLPTEQIARAGVGRTFQHAASMENITARDVILLGLHDWLPKGVLGYALPWRHRSRQKAAVQRAYDIAEQVGILEYVRSGVRFENLPYGVRKLTDLARALVAEPTLLLMDEPGAGLSGVEKSVMVDVIRSVRRERQITMMIVDHDLDFVSELVDELIVLDAGQKLASGLREEVLTRPDVIASYLGSDATEEVAS